MPRRSHAKDDLIVHSAEPLNAEPPLARLRSAFLTKTSDFYIRSHGDLPRIDAATHRIVVTGRVERALALTLAGLKDRFTPKTMLAVLQCAGNRRADLQRVEQTSGDPWDAGAIGNAEWTGVPLADVLRAAGTDETTCTWPSTRSTSSRTTGRPTRPTASPSRWARR